MSPAEIMAERADEQLRERHREANREAMRRHTIEQWVRDGKLCYEPASDWLIAGAPSHQVGWDMAQPITEHRFAEIALAVVTLPAPRRDAGVRWFYEAIKIRDPVT